MARFSEACVSDSFLQISESTLVAILNFNKLNISEFELLKACIRWIDSEEARQNVGPADPERKRVIFQRIKHLIRFSALSLTDFSSISKLEHYMTMEDIASVFLHTTQKSPLQIAYQSPRGPPKAYVTREIQNETIHLNTFTHESKITFSVNERIRLSSFTTLPVSSSCTSLHFQILKDGQVLSYGLNIEVREVAENLNSWTVQSAIILQPDIKYTLRFTFAFSGNHNNPFGTSKVMELKSAEDATVFKIEPASGSHCIERIGFWPY